MTRATQSAAKGKLSQAKVWDKVSAIQNGLSGFREQFARLEMALRTHAPSTALWVARSFLRYITGPVPRQLVRTLPCAGAQNMLKMQKKKK